MLLINRICSCSWQNLQYFFEVNDFHNTKKLLSKQSCFAWYFVIYHCKRMESVTWLVTFFIAIFQIGINIWKLEKQCHHALI